MMSGLLPNALGSYLGDGSDCDAPLVFEWPGEWSGERTSILAAALGELGSNATHWDSWSTVAILLSDAPCPDQYSALLESALASAAPLLSSDVPGLVSFFARRARCASETTRSVIETAVFRIFGEWKAEGSSEHALWPGAAWILLEQLAQRSGNPEASALRHFELLRRLLDTWPDMASHLQSWLVRLPATAKGYWPLLLATRARAPRICD